MTGWGHFQRLKAWLMKCLPPFDWYSDDNSKIAFVYANRFPAAVHACRHAFSRSLASAGSLAACVDYFEVPGALTLPLQVQLLARGGKYVAVVAVGLIDDAVSGTGGGVAHRVITALMETQLALQVLVVPVILTLPELMPQETSCDSLELRFSERGEEVAALCLAIMAASSSVYLRRTAEQGI